MVSEKLIVVITGGTGGLGQALAKHYLSQQATVIVTGRDEAKLQQTAEALGQPEHLHLKQVDVTNNEAVRGFAAWVQIHFGRCDILINNAGIAYFRNFSEMSLAQIQQTLATNIHGVLYITRAFLPMMETQGAGHIVNIASLAGRVATAKAAVYAASKAAIIQFSEGLRHELNGTGIHVTCVMPGPIDTPFLEHADLTGAYREKVSRFLLQPDALAEKISKAITQGKHELSLPFSLHFSSTLYQLLPERIKKWIAPYLNRK